MLKSQFLYQSLNFVPIFSNREKDLCSKSFGEAEQCRLADAIRAKHRDRLKRILLMTNALVVVAFVEIFWRETHVAFFCALNIALIGNR